MEDVLGLNSFLGSSAQSDVKAVTPPADPAVSSPDVKAETKADTKADTKGDNADLKGQDTKPKEDAKQAKTEVKEKSKAREEVKTDNTARVNDKSKEDYEKRYKDTQKWANEIHQKNLALERNNQELIKQTTIINKKLDGTYDPDVDDPKGPTPEQAVSQAEILGKVKASVKMAAEFYRDKGGEAYIEKMLYAPDAPFRRFDNNPAVQQMVLSSDAPVLAAMKILEEQEFRAKWGDNPEKIESAIRKKVEEELAEKLTKDIEAKIMERLGLKERQIQGVGGARAATGDSAAAAGGQKPLASFFALG